MSDCFCGAHDAECFSTLEAERDGLLQCLAKSEESYGGIIRGMKEEIDRLKADYEADHKISMCNLELYEQSAKDRDLWKAKAERLAKYVAHETHCIRSFFEAGEPTRDGGYRTKYKGKWYDSLPINNEPKCECGLEETFAEYEKGEPGE